MKQTDSDETHKCNDQRTTERRKSTNKTIKTRMEGRMKAHSLRLGQINIHER